tara:strand:- start:576 stop:761 length:186 start_codon:yes stop_codon:yes gene_type:complete
MTDFEKHQADAQRAFQKALDTGRLSYSETAVNFVGHYMYMGPKAGGEGDAFKHSLTREYLA